MAQDLATTMYGWEKYCGLIKFVFSTKTYYYNLL